MYVTALTRKKRRCSCTLYCADTEPETSLYEHSYNYTNRPSFPKNNILITLAENSPCFIYRLLLLN
jgi:hypothetical protein